MFTRFDGELDCLSIADSGDLLTIQDDLVRSEAVHPWSALSLESDSGATIAARQGHAIIVAGS
ncbi:MAG TPA: hypothetical protein VFH56_13415, partial [Acidimicrobiales bacterium]|nr:hypothetical protein [Acidimicrobiales bacterium]